MKFSKKIMALSKEDILNAIAEMSVMDAADLVSAMEEKFGVICCGQGRRSTRGDWW